MSEGTPLSASAPDREGHPMKHRLKLAYDYEEPDRLTCGNPRTILGSRKRGVEINDCFGGSGERLAFRLLVLQIQNTAQSGPFL